MSRLRIALLVGGLLAALGGGRARAQSEATRAEAKHHFEQGLRLYNVQSYEEAIVEFKAGYQADPRPEFLYALGQAQRMNRQCKAAIVSYEAYLRTEPAARQEAAAKDQIEACRAELATAASTPDRGQPVATPTPPPAVASSAAPVVAVTVPNVGAPPAASAGASNLADGVAASASTPADRAAPVYRRWWFWALIGGGVAAGLGVAAAAGVFTHTMEPGCPTGRYCP
jgi:iron complex outermembrane receptor protein